MVVANEPTSFGTEVILVTTGSIHMHAEASVTVSRWMLAVHIWAASTDHHQGSERSL